MGISYYKKYIVIIILLNFLSPFATPNVVEVEAVAAQNHHHHKNRERVYGIILFHLLNNGGKIFVILEFF